MHVKPEVERAATIRVIGVGGAGCNVLNHLIKTESISGVEFIAVNTDAQALINSNALTKIAIGAESTNGLGAGSKPEVGEKAALESIEEIKSHIEGADMIFVTAGMGGGTGTGAAPIIAKAAREMGALTIGVVTRPFTFEGKKRRDNAEIGLLKLSDYVDALITIPNQKLIETAEADLKLEDAFSQSDSILSQGVQGIADLIITPGLINVDFADVRTIMKGAGTALMGIGYGTGENRAEVAAQQAISSPLLDESIKGATGVLFNITGGNNIKMREVDQAANIISQLVSENANIIFGTTLDKTMDETIKITVIATGFESQVILNSKREGLDQQPLDNTEEPDNLSLYLNAKRNAMSDELKFNKNIDSEPEIEITESTKPNIDVDFKSFINSNDDDDADLSKTKSNDDQDDSNTVDNSDNDKKNNKKDDDEDDQLNKDYDKSFDVPAFLRNFRK